MKVPVPLVVSAGILVGCSEMPLQREAEGSYSGTGVASYFYDDDTSVRRADGYVDGRM